MGDELIFCRKAGCRSPECELHHIIPKAIDGTDKQGRVYLCPKHHDILQGMLIKIVWQFVPLEARKACWEAIDAFSRAWVKKE